MSKLGLGYGSEFHLLRILGRHRNQFNTLIKNKLKIEGDIYWFDFTYQNNYIPDKEIEGIDFLTNTEEYEKYKNEFNEYWPTSAGIQNWDSIGIINDTYFLIEAKARINEISSHCKAENKKSISLIEAAFKDTKENYKISSINDWKQNYYQKANRIAFLNFMDKIDIKAKLLFVYFINGYEKINSNDNIISKNDWLKALEKQDNYLCINNNDILKNKIFDIFIDIKNN